MNEVELMTKKVSEVKIPKTKDQKLKKAVSKPKLPLVVPEHAKGLSQSEVSKANIYHLYDKGNAVQIDPWILDINSQGFCRFRLWQILLGSRFNNIPGCTNAFQNSRYALVQHT